MPAHVRKGDLVYIRTGKNKGRTGTILRVNPKDQTAVVQGINVRKRHMRPTQANQQGGIVEKEMPIHLSNLSPVAEGKPTRVRFKTADNGAKLRIAARTGEQIGPELRKARG